MSEGTRFDGPRHCVLKGFHSNGYLYQVCKEFKLPSSYTVLEMLKKKCGLVISILQCYALFRFCMMIMASMKKSVEEVCEKLKM